MITPDQHQTLALAAMEYGAARARMHLAEGARAQAAADSAADEAWAKYLQLLAELTDWSGVLANGGAK